MSKENEIVAIFENETKGGTKILKGKTVRDVPAGTKVVLWPVDRSENPKRPAFRLELDTYVPKDAPAKGEYEKGVDEVRATYGEPVADEDIPF